MKIRLTNHLDEFVVIDDVKSFRKVDAEETGADGRLLRVEARSDAI